MNIVAAVSNQSEVDQAIDAIRAQKLSLLSMKRNAMTLEEAFIQIVGKDLS